MPKPTLKVRECGIRYEDFHYRSPMKFGGKVVDRVTLLHVTIQAEDAAGRKAQGTASMTMGNVWSWPSKTLVYDQTLAAMKSLAEKCRKATEKHPEAGHAFDLGLDLQPAFRRAAEEVRGEDNLPEDIPRLCTVVTASPFDLALHDAYGRLCGKNVYDCYGPEHCGRDLGSWLGPEFEGEYLDRYVALRPAASVPLYHTVGALDVLTEADIVKPAGDGLPDCLSQWIAKDGVRYFKIKLNGSDVAWDIQRLVSVDKVAREALGKQRVDESVYSLDFNETCPNVAYLLEFIAHFQQKDPETLRRVQLFEQPSPRNAKVSAENKLHEAATFKPLVADEALVDFESLRRCEELGYNGIALKACKGQSLALAMGAMAQKHKLFLCVMDLTCPGQSYLESAGLAARVPGVAAIEANARQYLPASAHEPWSGRYPEAFQIKDGSIHTSKLTEVGLGH